MGRHGLDRVGINRGRLDGEVDAPDLGDHGLADPPAGMQQPDLACYSANFVGCSACHLVASWGASVMGRRSM